MANGYPQYGGTNNVPLLDIGQAGGALDTAALARIVGVRVGPPVVEEKTVEHKTAQLTANFQDNLGFGGASVTWQGLFAAKDKFVFDDVLDDLTSMVTGSKRLPATGVLLPVNVNKLRPTILTDFDGVIITDRARIGQWRATGGRFQAMDGWWHVPIEIPFTVLG